MAEYLSISMQTVMKWRNRQKTKKNQAICEGIRFLYSAITSVHEKVVIKCYQWTHGIK